MSSGLLSLDWLQFYVDCKDFAIEPGIKVERQVFSTRQYKHVDYIYIEDILTATLAWEPHSQALKQHTGLLKFSNETLYHCVLPSIVPKVCKWLGLKIISISRVDICFDFQKFKYGLMPQTLITNFITSKYFKIGQAKYKVFGEQGAAIPYSYLRFGTATSPISVYLYNKTLEFQQVKQKNYILKAWEAYNFNKSLPVWRLEVSIKGNETKFIRRDDGEIIDLTFANLTNNATRADLFYSIVNKYFEFRVNDGQIRKDRMKRVEFFDADFEMLAIERITEKADSSRADKIFIKKLEMLNHELRGNDPDFWTATEKVKITFTAAAELENWLIKSRPHWKPKPAV